MNETESRILDALCELDSQVAQMRDANPKPDLLPLFSRIESLTAELPRGTNPELLHFLHKMSYEKARLWLQGRRADSTRGNCS